MTMQIDPVETPPTADTAYGDAVAQLGNAAHATRDWVSAHSGDIVLAAAAGVVIYLLLRMVRRQIRKAAVRHNDQTGFGAGLLRVLARTRHLFLIFVALRLVVGFANTPPALSGIIAMLFIVVCTVQAAIWAHEAIMTFVRQRAALAEHETLGSAITLINVMLAITLFIVAAIIILDNIGVNVTGLVAGLGIGGIAIGLAAKGVFEDLFAAIAIIFDRPFSVGDTVGYDQTLAKVERIGLKSTRLRSLNGEEIILSNTNLLAMELRNYESIPQRRFRLDFGVAYETPADKIHAIPAAIDALIATDGHELIRCGICRFAPSSIDFELLFDVTAKDYAAAFMARHRLALAIMDQFTASNIRFAYPAQISFTADPDGTLVSPWPPAMKHTAS